MEADDAGVVERARGGDTEAFRELVERHSRGLFRLAYRLTGSEADAEDVVQETFMKAYNNLHRFQTRAGVGTWLFRIATNCSVDLLRARRRRGVELRPVDPEDVDPVESLPARQPGPDQAVLGKEVHERVALALRLLSHNERAAFVLRHFEERPIAEVGRLLGLGENATKQSIFRAVRKLRRALEPLAEQAR